jgi:hypothetical protein
MRYWKPLARTGRALDFLRLKHDIPASNALRPRRFSKG